MQKSLDGKMLDLQDRPLKEKPGSDQEATVLYVITEALLATIPNENPSAEEKIKRYSLAHRIRKGGEQEFSHEELTLITKLVGKIFPPLIVGRVNEWAEI